MNNDLMENIAFTTFCDFILVIRGKVFLLLLVLCVTLNEGVHERSRPMCELLRLSNWENDLPSLSLIFLTYKILYTALSSQVEWKRLNIRTYKWMKKYLESS